MSISIAEYLKMFTLYCEGEELEVSPEIISRIPTFLAMVMDLKTLDIHVQHLTLDELRAILRTLENKEVPSIELIEKFDMLGIGVENNYEVAIATEMAIQEGLIPDSHTGLIELTETIWLNISPSHPIQPDIIPYNSMSPVVKRSWEVVTTGLHEIRKYLISPHLIAARSALHEALYTIQISHIELYLVGCDGEKANQILVDLAAVVQAASHKQIEYRRGENFIIIANIIIVRIELHKSIASLLHSFALDIHCLGYDGEKIWMTHRCRFAFEQHYVTVNPKLKSVAVEVVVSAGIDFDFGIRIPGLDRTRINKMKVAKATRQHPILSFATTSATQLEQLLQFSHMVKYNYYALQKFVQHQKKMERILNIRSRTFQELIEDFGNLDMLDVYDEMIEELEKKMDVTDFDKVSFVTQDDKINNMAWYGKISSGFQYQNAITTLC
jgi:hypothetical protein